MTVTFGALSSDHRVDQRTNSDCFRASVATALGITYEQANGPDYADQDAAWHEGWAGWAASHGLRLRSSERLAPIHLRRWIACVQQPADAGHVVVFDGRMQFHDPDPPDRVPGMRPLAPGPFGLLDVYSATWFEPADRRFPVPALWPLNKQPWCYVEAQTAPIT